MENDGLMPGRFCLTFLPPNTAVHYSALAQFAMRDKVPFDVRFALDIDRRPMFQWNRVEMIS